MEKTPRMIANERELEDRFETYKKYIESRKDLSKFKVEDVSVVTEDEKDLVTIKILTDKGTADTLVKNLFGKEVNIIVV